MVKPVGWVLGVLEAIFTLSLTSLVVYSFRDLLLKHIDLSFFMMPINIGHHGRVSATISASLASGITIRLTDWLALVWQACLEDSWMASGVGLFYAFVAHFLVTEMSTQAGLVAAIALPVVAWWRNVLAGVFPLLSVRLGRDPAATAALLMATVGNISGLVLLFSLSSVLVQTVPAFK